TPNACGDYDPSCTDVGIGPSKGFPFPISTDMPQNPNESDNGVVRDMNGYLTLSASSAAFNYLWIANTSDVNGKGNVSKMDSKAIKELARYFSVTCSSNQVAGPNDPCDGTKGCCARDSYPQWTNRKNNQPSGVFQQINLDSNFPSRTAIDF